MSVARCARGLVAVLYRRAGLVALCALAGAAGVVLLSPAAPSYDHYRDFEERGERFQALAGWRRPQEA